MLCVSRELIMFKAKSVYDEKFGDNEELKAGFVASNGMLCMYKGCPRKQTFHQIV